MVLIRSRVQLAAQSVSAGRLPHMDLMITSELLGALTESSPGLPTSEYTVRDRRLARFHQTAAIVVPFQRVVKKFTVVGGSKGPTVWTAWLRCGHPWHDAFCQAKRSCVHVYERLHNHHGSGFPVSLGLSKTFQEKPLIVFNKNVACRLLPR